MSKKTDNQIQTIITGATRHTRELLQLYLDEHGTFSFLAAADDYVKVYSALKDLKKTLVITDISTNTEQALSFINTISANFPHCKIVAISDKPDVNLAVKVMRAGELVALPLLKEDFFAALDRVNDEFQGAPKKSKCRILTVYSNKGGVGKTSVATNLALELAKTTKENVALVDLNFQPGDITTFMDVQPSFNISYVLQNLNKINKDFLLNTLERYKDTSLYILADPPFFKQEVSSKQICSLLEILRETFSYVVVDTSANLDKKTTTLFDNSDMVLLVSIVNLPALRNCQKCLELFEKLGYPPEKIQVLINRYLENDDIKIEDVEELLGREVYQKIPNNYFTMMASINKGIPVSYISPDSNVAQAYKDLALLVAETMYKQAILQTKTCL